MHDRGRVATRHPTRTCRVESDQGCKGRFERIGDGVLASLPSLYGTLIDAPKPSSERRNYTTSLVSLAQKRSLGSKGAGTAPPERRGLLWQRHSDCPHKQ
eukprot:scaffold810_cov355-Pavlova_lutheri.AAC.20